MDNETEYAKGEAIFIDQVQRLERRQTGRVQGTSRGEQALTHRTLSGPH
ncbi:MAG TPA: hypothetical protein QF517_03330 [Pseudomonadales bacterium]|nr:hypothetical protein [Pseudomonadales bacterium]MDP7576390.1 hypothetical protein [Pseudomonadales bacterium]HJL60963.1 hypothetical protein [Pseudomonadales bacterium]